MCIWIVPGCLALSVVHLRQSVIHINTNIHIYANTFTYEVREMCAYMHLARAKLVYIHT